MRNKSTFAEKNKQDIRYLDQCDSDNLSEEEPADDNERRFQVSPSLKKSVSPNQVYFSNSPI